MICQIMLNGLYALSSPIFISKDTQTLKPLWQRFKPHLVRLRLGLMSELVSPLYLRRLLRLAAGW